MKGKGYKLSMVLLASLMSINLFTACGKSGEKENKNKQNQEQKENANGSISGADNISIKELEEFDPLAGITAKDKEGKDVTANIEVKGEVDTTKAGEYKLTYTLKGTDLSVTRVVTVTAVEAALANGTYNFKFADAELRNHLMAAAEDYLLHNQMAGIPLFSNAGAALYSSRVQLASEKYIPQMGFGVSVSTMSQDDSNVLMEDGKKGKAGEYTFRSTLGQNPADWNQWKSSDATSSDLMEFYYGSLYNTEFNEDKSGYVINPSMAAEDPIALESTTLDTGKVISKKWQVKIREGLEWKFHPKTDTSMITDTTINAVDFYDTYKYALEQKWFRAVSGGGDFCVSSNKIVNAQEFVDGKAKWEDVGIKLIDDNTIEFNFVENKSLFDVKYFLGGSTMSPVNMELVSALGEKYAIDEKTIAYSGPYYVDYFENDKIVRMSKNDKYHEPKKHFYTNRNYSVIVDAEMVFQEFVAGKLDAVSLPATHYDEYKNDPRKKDIPGATVFRFVFNGFGTKEAQIKKFPNSKWDPEPILGNKDFGKAMFHAIDRNKLAKDVMKTSQPMMYLFSDAYVVEAESGIAYRSTEAGKSVGADLSPSTHGYNLDAAKVYYEKALDDLVEQGVYKSGDVITLEFCHFSGSETQALIASYLKDAFETAFTSEKHNIKVTIEGTPKDYPAIYNDHMLIAEMDTGVGGIKGSTLDAASFLEVYCTDNRSGFTMGFGLDSSVPEIEVAYKNIEGKQVKEIWSFDALNEALNGETKVVDGKAIKKEKNE